MGKVSYMMKRIAGLNYRQFFDVVTLLHKKTGKTGLGCSAIWSTVDCAMAAVIRITACLNFII